MLVATFYVLLTPVQKFAAAEKINLSAYVPSSFGNWNSVQYDMSDYKDRWQSINELIIREYTNQVTKEQVILIVEYNSDLRRNFTFHFPESCYRAVGQEVAFLPFLSVPLPDHRVLNVKSIFVRGAKDGFNQGDKILAYWLVIDNKQYSRTFIIKLNQFFAGILQHSRKGFLVRLDSEEGIRYDDQGIRQINGTMSRFIADLYMALDENRRQMFFGK